VIQTLLFVAGINTLLQSFLGTRLPAVIGGSYTFVAPTISIILAGRYSGIADPHEVCPPSRLSRLLAFALLIWWVVAAEILAHHAGDAGRVHSGLHPPNHHGVQWPLAHCRQVCLLSRMPFRFKFPIKNC
jgi:hypothetical protein